MRVSAKLGLSVIGALCLGATTATAQQGVHEIGADVFLTPMHVTGGDFSVGRARMGFFMSPAVSLEPAFAFGYSNIDNDASYTSLNLDLGLLYHFNPNRSANQVYVRPFVGLNTLSVNPDDPAIDSNSDSQFGFGAGLGMKWPIIPNRFSARGEFQLSHYLETDRPARTNIGFTVGFSVFNR